MRLLRVWLTGEEMDSVAVETEKGFLPLLGLEGELAKAGVAGADDLWWSMPDVLAAGPEAWNRIREVCSRANTGPDFSSEIALLPVAPESFRDFMLFEKHAVQAARGFARKYFPGAYRVAAAYERLTGKVFPRFKPHALWYQRPLYYQGNHLAFVPDGHPVAFASYSQVLDYELELGAVIAKPLYNATPEEALAAVGGFVIVNDFSARDVQLKEMKSGFGPMKTKSFATSMSRVLVTADEIPDIEKLTARVLINGREVASGDFRGMHHSLGEAIAFASRDERIHPGELLATGTVPNCCALENGHWVKPGDVLTLEIPPVGTLENPIVAAGQAPEYQWRC
ncbi:MAG: fumarylacetoacetate hydrolase family protein [Thermodesulfobacteriota bacterium]